MTGRSARFKRYDELLKTLRLDKDSDEGHDGAKTTLCVEIESETQQEEALTLLKFSMDKYAGDVLTSQEAEVTVKAFQFVAQHSNMVMELPSWFVAPFEFTGTFGLSRWGERPVRAGTLGPIGLHQGGGDVVGPEPSSRGQVPWCLSCWTPPIRCP